VAACRQGGTSHVVVELGGAQNRGGGGHGPEREGAAAAAAAVAWVGPAGKSMGGDARGGGFRTMNLRHARYRYLARRRMAGRVAGIGNLRGAWWVPAVLSWPPIDPRLRRRRRRHDTSWSTTCGDAVDVSCESWRSKKTIHDYIDWLAISKSVCTNVDTIWRRRVDIVCLPGAEKPPPPQTSISYATAEPTGRFAYESPPQGLRVFHLSTALFDKGTFFFFFYTDHDPPQPATWAGGLS
jgi:hypothetical protein